MRRISLLLALAALAGEGTALATTSGWVPYNGRHSSSRISFLHPSEWKARFAGFTWPPYGSPQYLIVALSTERLHNPDCRAVTQPDGTSREECSPIMDSLPPEGVYVEWWENWSTVQPDGKLTQVRGNPTRVGGEFAKVLIDPTSATAGTICPKQTTGSVQLHIAGTLVGTRPGGRREVYMYACTNTTNFPHFMSQLLPMVRSVRFLAGSRR